MVKCFYVADMSDSSLSGTGSTCMKKKRKKYPLFFLLPPRDNDWLVATEWQLGYGTLRRHNLYSLFGVHNTDISFRFDSVLLLLDL